LTEVIARLREFLAALERRTPRPERANEREISCQAEMLKKEALDRIADLDRS
jgi:hypothetical protein